MILPSCLSAALRGGVTEGYCSGTADGSQGIYHSRICWATCGSCFSEEGVRGTWRRWLEAPHPGLPQLGRGLPPNLSILARVPQREATTPCGFEPSESLGRTMKLYSLIFWGRPSQLSYNSGPREEYRRSGGLVKHLLLWLLQVEWIPNLSQVDFSVQ